MKVHQEQQVLSQLKAMRASRASPHVRADSPSGGEECKPSGMEASQPLTLRDEESVKSFHPNFRTIRRVLRGKSVEDDWKDDEVEQQYQMLIDCMTPEVMTVLHQRLGTCRDLNSRLRYDLLHTEDELKRLTAEHKFMTAKASVAVKEKDAAEQRFLLASQTLNKTEDELREFHEKLSAAEAEITLLRYQNEELTKKHDNVKQRLSYLDGGSDTKMEKTVQEFIDSMSKELKGIVFSRIYGVDRHYTRWKEFMKQHASGWKAITGSGSSLTCSVTVLSSMLSHYATLLKWATKEVEQKCSSVSQALHKNIMSVEDELSKAHELMLAEEEEKERELQRQAHTPRISMKQVTRSVAFASSGLLRAVRKRAVVPQASPEEIIHVDASVWATPSMSVSACQTPMEFISIRKETSNCCIQTDFDIQREESNLIVEQALLATRRLSRMALERTTTSTASLVPITNLASPITSAPVEDYGFPSFHSISISRPEDSLNDTLTSSATWPASDSSDDEAERRAPNPAGAPNGESGAGTGVSGPAGDEEETPRGEAEEEGARRNSNSGNDGSNKDEDDSTTRTKRPVRKSRKSRVLPGRKLDTSAAESTPASPSNHGRLTRATQTPAPKSKRDAVAQTKPKTTSTGVQAQIKEKPVTKLTMSEQSQTTTIALRHKGVQVAVDSGRDKEPRERPEADADSEQDQSLPINRSNPTPPNALPLNLAPRSRVSVSDKTQTSDVEGENVLSESSSESSDKPNATKQKRKKKMKRNKSIRRLYNKKSFSGSLSQQFASEQREKMQRSVEKMQEQIQSMDVAQLFKQYDMEDKGSLGKAEFTSLMVGIGLGNNFTSIDELFNYFDADGSGGIDIKELLGNSKGAASMRRYSSRYAIPTTVSTHKIVEKPEAGDESDKKEVAKLPPIVQTLGNEEIISVLWKVVGFHSAVVQLFKLLKYKFGINLSIPAPYKRGERKDGPSNPVVALLQDVAFMVQRDNKLLAITLQKIKEDPDVRLMAAAEGLRPSVQAKPRYLDTSRASMAAGTLSDSEAPAASVSPAPPEGEPNRMGPSPVPPLALPQLPGQLVTQRKSPKTARASVAVSAAEANYETRPKNVFTRLSMSRTLSRPDAVAAVSPYFTGV